MSRDGAVTFAGRTPEQDPFTPSAPSRYLEMRELDHGVPLCAIVGAGRMGRAMAAALPGALGPFGRCDELPDGDAVLLCVPDAEIDGAAAAVAPGPLVGHCSGATTLEPIVGAGHEAFSVHPLMTVAPDAPPSVFAGAGAATAGSTPRAQQAAETIARALGMNPVAVADEDRVAYHAAAAIASNFLTTIEGAAERLAATAGVERAMLVPLVRASVENWASLGAARALTGPIARGDNATVDRHRAAISERTPELLPLYDALAGATRELAA
jgi:predicted short-subunit dehydrogenase-like oxidoreductase (DUF2520 family)